MKFSLESLFKSKTPKLNPEREMLIREQNKFEELNALMFYEIVKETDTIDCVYLHDNEDMPASEELFLDAMKKLAKVVREDTKLQIIRIDTFFVQLNYDLLLEMGFCITDVPKDIARFTKTSAVARIEREDFLKRFGGNSEEK
jgi:hypothetical protein